VCVISLHSGVCVCVSIHTHIHTKLCVCFHDREGRYDQEQGICIMVSILGIYMSYRTFCATAVPRIQVHLFIMTKTADSWDVTSASILYLSEVNLTIDDDFTSTSSEAQSWMWKLMTLADIDIILHICKEVEWGKLVPCQEY